MSLGPHAPRKALDTTTFLDTRIEVDRRDADGTVWIAFTQKYGGCEKRHVIALDADECWTLVRALMASATDHPDGSMLGA